MADSKSDGTDLVEVTVYLIGRRDTAKVYRGITIEDACIRYVKSLEGEYREGDAITVCAKTGSTTLTIDVRGEMQFRTSCWEERDFRQREKAESQARPCP